VPAINAGEFVIVAGDLNDGRGEPALRRIRGLMISGRTSLKLAITSTFVTSIQARDGHTSFRGSATRSTTFFCQPRSRAS
jgi:hypothetical protein